MINATTNLLKALLRGALTEIWPPAFSSSPEGSSVSVAFSTLSRREGAAPSRTSFISSGVFTGAFISSSLLVEVRRHRLVETGAGGGLVGAREGSEAFVNYCTIR